MRDVAGSAEKKAGVLSFLPVKSSKFPAKVSSFLLVESSRVHAKVLLSRFVKPSQLLAFLQVPRRTMETNFERSRDPSTRARRGCGLRNVAGSAEKQANEIHGETPVSSEFPKTNPPPILHVKSSPFPAKVLLLLIESRGGGGGFAVLAGGVFLAIPFPARLTCGNAGGRQADVLLLLIEEGFEA